MSTAGLGTNSLYRLWLRIVGTFSDAADRFKQRGITGAEARHAVLVKLDAPEIGRGRNREHGRFALLDQLVQDLRFAFRMLRKAPGFTAAAVLTLALGIGANTAIFSVINAVILRPLPYPSADRIVAVTGTVPLSFVAKPEFHFAPADWIHSTRAFQRIAAYETGEVNLAGFVAEPERVAAAEVMPDFFDIFGVAPAAGRTYLPEEEVSGHAPVAILSYSFCTRFGSPQEVVGRSIVLNGRKSTVVGVMPPGFEFPSNTRVWLPFAWRFEDEMLAGQALIYETVGRLNPQVSAEQAQEELIDITSRPLGKVERSQNQSRILRLHDQLVGQSRKTLWLLLGAVAFVLLIACANVANLVIIRAVNRRSEIGVRLALGASRARLARQILAETMMLSALGGVAAILLATWTIRGMLHLIPPHMLFVQTIPLDLRVLGFLIASSVASGILFGFFPLIQTLGADLNDPLNRRNVAAPSARSFRVGPRNLLAVSEIAIALVLLAGAGLLIRSFSKLVTAGTGFQPDRVVTARLALSSHSYDQASKSAAFYTITREKISNLPGVVAVGYVSDLPFSQAPSVAVKLPIERPTASYQAKVDQVSVQMYEASPGYFSAIGIPVMSGREFRGEDVAAAPLVALISKSLAEDFWPDEDPIGKRIGVPAAKSAWAEIVGVVGDAKHRNFDEKISAACYFSILQFPVRGVSMVVHTAAAPRTVESAIRRTITDSDNTLPLTPFRPMVDLLSDSVAEPRFRTLLLGIFAALALILASCGVYGVMSYAVAERTREIGIRMALGASPHNVLAMVLRRSLSVTLFGIAAGIAASWALTRLLVSSLYLIAPHDLFTLASTSLLLGAVALFASYLPARRATRIDPLTALRHE